MHERTHNQARGTVAALVLILAALTPLSLTAPPLGGLAVLAMVAGAVGVVLVAHVEAVAQ